MDPTGPLPPVRHSRREPLITFPRVVIAVIIVGLAAVLGGLVDNTRRLDDLNADVELAREQRDALVRQVERLGEKPVVNVPPGERGPAGEPGIQGPPGPQGATGPRGPRGAHGLRGAEGDIGATGTTGETGPAGEVGEIGPAGPPGPAPESFTFTVGPSVFTCTDQDSDGDYTCIEEKHPPSVETP